VSFPNDHNEQSRFESPLIDEKINRTQRLELFLFFLSFFFLNPKDDLEYQEQRNQPQSKKAVKKQIPLKIKSSNNLLSASNASNTTQLKDANNTNASADSVQTKDAQDGTNRQTSQPSSSRTAHEG
jgi:hypothetical protein